MSRPLPTHTRPDPHLDVVVDYPICLRLAGRPVTVIGAGVVARGRIEALLAAGAVVQVIAPRVHDDVANWAEAGLLDLHRRRATVDDAVSARVLFIAIDDDPTELAAAARAAGALLNVADVPALCDFTLPSVGRVGPVTVAVATSGQGPAVARLLRQQLTAQVQPRHLQLLRLTQWLRRRHPAGPARMRLIREIVEGEIGTRLLAGHRRAAFVALRQRLTHIDTFSSVEVSHRPHQRGSVTLVGAGPGDADLLTLRALRALTSADVVVTDRLVGDDVLAIATRANPSVRVLWAGKSGGGASVPQATITQMLIDEAKAGHRVVRLKGGDPFVFGRGGEEVQALREAGLDVTMVPGLTAGVAVPGLAGIPVTHRGLARSVLFATATVRDDVDGKPVLDDVARYQSADTLVLYMAGQQLPAVTHALIAAGRAGATPAAVIERGAQPGERVITGTLADIAVRCADAAVGSPALTIIGDVVALRPVLADTQRPAPIVPSSAALPVEAPGAP